MSYRLLIINPSSTSTKIGIYEDEKSILQETLAHSSEEIKKFYAVYDEVQFREETILKVLKDKNIDIKSLNVVVARGGLLKPIESGTYEVNDTMVEDLKIGVQGQHAVNLGGIIAKKIGDLINVPAFIVDPVVVDEMEDVARISGMPEIERKSKFHALNQKAIARRYAKENNKNYEKLNLIVTHMGLGVSVGAHKQGRVVDVNNSLDGEGPFSLEGCGGIPIGDLAKLCYSGKYTLEEMRKRINGQGGIAAHLGTDSFEILQEKVDEGDSKAKLIFDAFVFQVAKEIGKCAAILCGKVDAVILTGEIAYNENVISAIKDSIGFIAPVVVYPGENELLALAQGVLRVLKGEEKAKEYK